MVLEVLLEPDLTPRAKIGIAQQNDRLRAYSACCLDWLLWDSGCWKCQACRTTVRESMLPVGTRDVWLLPESMDRAMRGGWDIDTKTWIGAWTGLRPFEVQINLVYKDEGSIWL